MGSRSFNFNNSWCDPFILHFFYNKFDSRNEDLNASMNEHSLVLTKETTMWKAWIGFNASHSSGAIFIGIMNIFWLNTILIHSKITYSSLPLILQPLFFICGWPKTTGLRFRLQELRSP